MSKVTDKITDVITKLDAHIEGWKGELDRKTKVELTDNLQFGINPTNRTLVISAVYTDANGTGHPVQIATQLQRDDNDSITIDGVEMTKVIVDEDIMGFPPRVQLEVRYTNPNEVPTEPATGDNRDHINLGGGQHEFRLIKEISVGDSGIFGELKGLLTQLITKDGE